MSKLTTWLLALLPVALMAQERQQLKGKAITDIGNVDGVGVTNAATGANAVTGSEGDFSIAAQKGDTLRFTSEQFRPLAVVLRQQDFAEAVFVVKLEPVATMLEEVVVSSLTGNLAADSKSIKTMQVNTLFDPVEINKDVVVQTGIGGANWIAGAVQLFKKKKQPKRATAYKPPADYVEKSQFSEVVRAAYPDSFFTETLTIPVRFIGAFLNFCDGDAKQYLQIKQNEPQLLEYLKTKSAEFLKLNPDAR
ncbi:carboxypeptidase-like regulatory domain-containing protein [Flavobacterium sp. MFBS3-15]|uniref:carboxypeptidase-like regulatory domain-containing protein n=1 Tax=Flavobacterium sp. MFBS3-15 TaxID=2989816 RepID=UPI00223621C4|nr:carboxypeptidase-like regulatory domain-containing protein [Flavobacterium sp. MFBS3-15]MCW4469357.1 carboxypeptidase-like regulatory domain-containing protein [Flavobacterium sp. MFBS3-15]